MITESDFKKIGMGALIVILIIVAFLIVKPIILAIIWGLIFAYIFYPVYLFILKNIKERNISSLIVVFIAVFILFIPIWFILPVLVRQLIDAYSFFQSFNFMSLINAVFPNQSPTFQSDIYSIITSFISKITSYASSYFSDVFLNLPTLALSAVVILFTFFFTLRDGEKLKNYVKEISPFNKSVEDNLSAEFKGITKAVIYGYIVVGIIQGLLTGLGLFIFGVPQALLLTIIASFAAIIPVLGAWLVWIPASIYLISSGHIGAGIGLIIYGAVFISWIDNALRIWIVSRKTKLSSALVFIGMIGGLMVFGLIGLVLGPLILAYLLILLDAYKEKKFSNLFS